MKTATTSERADYIGRKLLDLRENHINPGTRHVADSLYTRIESLNDPATADYLPYHLDLCERWLNLERTPRRTR